MSPKAPLPYRLLLLLLPPPFRRDFGADLEAVLVKRLRDAIATSRCRFCCIMALPLVARSLLATQQGRPMTPEDIERLRPIWMSTSRPTDATLR